MKNNQNNLLSIIDTLYTILDKNTFINHIQRNVHFYDEPLYYSYAAQLVDKIKLLTNQGYISDCGSFVVGGLSLVSKENALVRCLGEAAERSCLYSYLPKEIQKISLSKPYNNMIDVRAFPNTIQNESIGVVQAKQINTNATRLVPAQLIYLNYNKHSHEELLDCPVSSGAAFGTNHLKTMLTGIYEVIERDAIMLSYLTQCTKYRIHIKNIPFLNIRKINKKLSQYHLKWYLFDVQNTLSIPTYLSVLVDKTGGGPAITIGSKTGFDAEQCMLGSVEEALMTRAWGRQLRVDSITHILHPKKEVTIREDHLSYWYDTKKIQKLSWLLKLPEKPFIENVTFKNIEAEFDAVMNICLSCGFEVLSVDIASTVLKNAGYFVYKILIPGLQSLYFNESTKDFFINKNRIRSVKGKMSAINSIPHPFL